MLLSKKKIIIIVSSIILLMIIGYIINFSEFFDERCYQGQVWLIEYEYPSFSFSAELVERKLSENTSIFDEKLKIRGFGSLSDYMNRFPEESQDFDFLDDKITDNTHILEIECLWQNNQKTTKTHLEQIDGITNARYFSSWIE